MTPASHLPTPADGFAWRATTWGVVLMCEPLAKVAQHLFTTRQLQLRNAPGCETEWRRVLEELGGSTERLLRIKQVHGRTIHRVRHGDRASDPSRDLTSVPEADGVASNVPGAVLAVQVADCVPLLMADPASGAVAAVHAGWRGTCQRIAARAVQTLIDDFGADPAAVVAAIGPSIGACCYEVGPEVRESFRTAGANDDEVARWFDEDGPSLRLDLWAANRDQLIATGVLPDNLHVSRLCTKTHRAVFHSFRADGPQAGRMAAMVQVPGR